MEKEAREEIRKIIVEQLKQVREDIVNLKQASKPIPPDDSIGRLTRMEAINEQSINEANLRKAELRLQRLEAAIKRVDAENFGECFKCGEEIPMARLRILPESVICVDCLNEDD